MQDDWHSNRRRSHEDEISRLTAENERLQANVDECLSCQTIKRVRTERDALQEKCDAVCEEHSEQVDAWCELKVERDALRAALQEIANSVLPFSRHGHKAYHGWRECKDVAEAALKTTEG